METEKAKYRFYGAVLYFSENPQGLFKRDQGDF